MGELTFYRLSVKSAAWVQFILGGLCSWNTVSDALSSPILTYPLCSDITFGGITVGLIYFSDRIGALKKTLMNGSLRSGSILLLSLRS